LVFESNYDELIRDGGIGGEKPGAPDTCMEGSLHIDSGERMVRTVAQRARVRFQRMVESKRADAPTPTPAEEGSRPSDAAVVRGLLASEAWAASELYSRTHLAVERSVRRVLQSSDLETEDLIQMAFERVVRTLVEQRFSGRCSLRVWASAIARERDVFVSPASDEAKATPSYQGLERQLEARAELARLHGILGRMSEKQAKILVLHDVFGHELREIAELLSLSLPATQSNLARGRHELLRRVRARVGVSRE
jgi:RNA polymerase sigma factor (sigma-70 family)